MIATTEDNTKEIKIESNVPVTITVPEDSILNKLVKPHDKKSREAVEKDVETIVADSVTLYQLCFTGNGLYQGAYAMHHSQINDTDPIDFFVTHKRDIFINPKIVKHSSYLKDSKEACMTFADRPQTIVSRWQKITVTYQTIMVDPENEGKFKLSSVIEVGMSGPESFVFQHEADHGQALYIYQTDII